jgi:hypothetical protein
MRIRVAAALLLAFSCTSAPAARQPPDGPSSQGTPSSSSEEEPFVRTCESSVFGELGRGWRDGSILAGPLAFVGAVGYAHQPARFFEESRGRWSGQKILVRITGATPVTVQIHPAAWSFAGLLYDPASFNTRRPELRQAAVRFEPCRAQAATQFNGAFLVDGVHCVPVTVTVEGKGSQGRILEFGPCPR